MPLLAVKQLRNRLALQNWTLASHFRTMRRASSQLGPAGVLVISDSNSSSSVLEITSTLNMTRGFGLAAAASSRMSCNPMPVPAAVASGSGPGALVPLHHGDMIPTPTRGLKVCSLSARSAGERSADGYQDACADEAGNQVAKPPA
jgi:hypothetical protein